MNIYNNVLLSTILWYQIGGVARYVLDVASREELYDALEFVKSNKITKVFVLGLGSNLLFPDEGFDGAIIRFLMQEDGKGIQLFENNIVDSFAGEFLDSIIHFGFDKGLVGLEWAGGLPGTVGAAVRGNVGAFGGEIKDVFVKAHAIRWFGDGDYEEVTLNNEEMKFSYRTSRVKEEKLIVVSAQFQLKQATPEELLAARETYYANITYRQDKHPLDYPNCGSVFKNISKKEEVERILESWPDVRELVEGKWHGKVSMGYVIDRLGLKGQQNGAAQISEKHQNFIVNKGGAKAHEVKGLIAEIEEEMQESFGFTPEVEVEIIS
ncbi:MAG: UDP-N-acetylmuramate dehydrogenase [Candidatus Levybacteria bacterium]|nr:UDP-N-acetylmuramate dehydrogenase [Candidatus Levybacteria bacterium]